MYYLIILNQNVLSAEKKCVCEIVWVIYSSKHPEHTSFLEILKIIIYFLIYYLFFKINY